MNKAATSKQQPISTMPLTPRHYFLLVVCSMEQIIGTAISALAGIVLPIIALSSHQELSPFLQGITGSIALIGIACGSAIIGRISDEKGYAVLFRICPILIALGTLLPFLFPNTACLVIGLGIAGFGVGGGYSLDSSYISELMPSKWSLFMVGVAKASCALGFIGIPFFSWLIIRHWETPEIWPWLMLLVCALGVISFLLRINFPDSPRWLMDKGYPEKAQKAAEWFFGPDAEVLPLKTEKVKTPATWGDMFKGPNLKKVLFSGIPWACEGVGVYGIGVFLPVLVMSLGIDTTHLAGMPKIVNSVALTTIINCFILPGFIIGLLIVHKCWHVTMLTWGFIFYSIGVGIVMAAYLLKWPLWVSLVGFMIFEIALNGGPHLITYIIPPQIYSVSERGAGVGIAAMAGKLGAILGVFLMPVLLHSGGIVLVLIFCIAVGLIGAMISAFLGREVLPRNSSKSE